MIHILKRALDLKGILNPGKIFQMAPVGRISAEVMAAPVLSEDIA